MDSAAQHPRARISAMVRQAYREEARREGNENHLADSAWSKWQSVNTRFYLGAQSAESLEWDIHDLWYLYYEAAKNISEEHPALDRLVLHIVHAREQGLLVRETEDTMTEAVTTDGRIWTDLPFLIPDMSHHWHQDHPALSSQQRLSFAKFLAKLAAAGVGRDDGLCQIALTTSREALETENRPLGTLADHQQPEDPNRREANLSIAAYLPSVNVWLSWAGLKIIQISESNKSWNTSTSAGDDAPGPLFLRHAGGTAELGTGPSLGFCAERWVFWLIRLESLAASFRNAGEEALSAFVSAMMDNMLVVVDATGGPLKREVARAQESGTVVRRLV